VTLKHSFWELELPRCWVSKFPQLQDFFDRKIPAQDIDALDPELCGVLTLLGVQGCLSYPDDRSYYTLEQVKELFASLCSQWYGRYYAHPLWQKLRAGSLSRNALVAWLLHNYHVSRSAGMSDARCATRFLRSDLRPRFARNALEEFSHYDDYYFVRHPNLSLADAEVKAYVHLPSSLAFDQQMLRMADDDWLGHVLVSFFQESTVRFFDDCKTFYALVEQNYDIPGFFAPWKQHIELDLKYGHADNFGTILSSDYEIPKSHLIRSLRNAWFTFEYLIGGLDEVLEQDVWGNTIYLRMPIQDGLLSPQATALLAPYSLDLSSPRHVTAERCDQLYGELRTLKVTNPPPRVVREVRFPIEDRDFLFGDFTLSLYQDLRFEC